MINTFKNKQGRAIVRSCKNCMQFLPVDPKSGTGYCRAMPMVFAFTGEHSVFAIVKKFYRCDSGHRFANEEHLERNAEQAVIP